jgi:vancomycin aglycone glucosyltransferase
MRVLLTMYGARGDIQPVGRAVRVRALGAQVQVCAPPDQELAEVLGCADVPLAPIGQPVRPRSKEVNV